MSWESEKIGNVCNVGDGAHASIKRTLNGIPYYTSKNFKIDGIDLSKVDYISEEDYKKHFRSNSNAITKPIKDDILLSIIGSIGAPHLVKDEDDFGLSSSVSILRPNVSKIEPQFLFYWIKSDDFQNAVHQIKSGVAQSFLSLSMIKQLPVVFPKSLPTQKRIASILSAYDDLIENNLKRIKLLEETAQNIYKEWFVNFRFPNYENTPINQDKGLPEGWEVKTISQFGTVITGKTPSTSNENYYGGNIPFVKTPDMHDAPYVIETSIYLSNEGAESQNNKFLPKNSVMVSCIGTAGVVSLTSENCQTNQQINSVKFDQEFKSFYFFSFAKGLKTLLEGLGSNGATMVNVNKSKFENIDIVIPREHLLCDYHSLVNPIFNQILVLQVNNQKLKEARDILLPRLMNRTIEV